MFEKLKIYIILAVGIAILLYLLPLNALSSYITYFFYSDKDLSINLSLVNPQIKTITADPSNKLILKVEVRDSTGMPVPNARFNLSVSSNIGSIIPSSGRTDKYGDCLVTYHPPSYSEVVKNKKDTITITGNLGNKKLYSSVSLKLINIPVVFIHGYQETADMFDSMYDYLTDKRFRGFFLSYNSRKGVNSAAKELNTFLQNKKMDFLSEGVQVKKFSLVTHSLGGLVARYYTSSSEYIKKNDIEKIIFISVPHQGSYLAQIGESLFNDQSIKDLSPEGTLLSTGFPTMINSGLNPTIQVGNILGQFDEVVTDESASLEDWGIKTELFNVGDNNFSMGSILNGNILEAPNHKNILNNKKVFKKVEEMLNVELSHPLGKRKKLKETP